MRRFASAFWFLVFVLCSALCRAQEETGERPEMADGLRASGKIYVVVAVVVVILLGVVFYLVQLDRKIRKLEKSEKHFK